jgi:hypothetical protein
MGAPLRELLYGSSSMGAPLRSSSVAAPLQQALYSSSFTAATQRQPADLGLRRGASATLNHCRGCVIIHTDLRVEHDRAN